MFLDKHRTSAASIFDKISLFHERHMAHIAIVDTNICNPTMCLLSSQTKDEKHFEAPTNTNDMY